MKVFVDYFKESGKWYESYVYETKLTKDDSLLDVWAELRDMLENGKRPGLVDGKHEFNTLINVPEHPHAHPHMIMKDSLRNSFK